MIKTAFPFQKGEFYTVSEMCVDGWYKVTTILDYWTIGQAREFPKLCRLFYI